MMHKHTRWLVSLILAITVSFSAAAQAAAFDFVEPDNYGTAVFANGTVYPTYKEAYESMVALKEKYPEGMPWTNFEPYGKNGKLGDAYWWKGGKVKGASGGVGCAAFVFILSDEAFGDLPARTIDRGGFKFEDIKVGDILRMDGNSHFVIVLQTSVGGITVAEANYNKSVHWGRAISVQETMTADFLVTRYPENFIPPDAPDAGTIIQSGKEEALSWSLTTAGMLTISGNGAIPDFSMSASPSWAEYNDFINTIVIEDGVTGIGNYAFYQSKALSIYIPDSVTRIGEGAFYKSAIVGVTIPGSVKTIGKDAFYKCPNLTSATVSEGVETIDEQAFRGCVVLKYIDFPSSIRSVGAGAFASCPEMTRVRFMPSKHTVTMGDNLFTQCWKLMDVTLPQMADRISEGMFESCTLLSSIYIPAGVSEIGRTSFAQTSLALGNGISFGGSETTWNTIGGKGATLSMPNVRIQYNVSFEDPFAPIPGDPGDISFEDKDPNKCEHGNNPNDCAICNPSDGSDSTPDNSGGSSGNSGGNSDKSDNTTSANKPDSSATTTTVDKTTGIKTETTKKPDGSSIVTVTQKNGTTTTTSTDTTGKVAIEVRLTAAAISADAKGDKPIVLPISEVKVSGNIAATPAITVSTETKEPIKVAVPTVSPTAGTVAMLINADGSSSVVKTSVLMGSNIVVPLSGDATIKIVDNSKSFSDVTAEMWAKDAIAFVSARELFSGTTETTFDPDIPMSRAMLMTVLARFDGEDPANGETWYEQGVNWAIQHGISDGSSPNSEVTREQVVTMLWRYLGSPAPANTISGYTDASQINGYAQDAMNWAVENNIIGGFGDGVLEPQGLATRAQVAQILKNYTESIVINRAQ